MVKRSDQPQLFFGAVVKLRSQTLLVPAGWVIALDILLFKNPTLMFH